MSYLALQQIIDSFVCDIWRTATSPTAMDEDRLPAQQATAMSILVLILLFLLINNTFTLSKKQQNCNVSKEKDFSVDSNEYNAIKDFLLST